MQDLHKLCDMVENSIHDLSKRGLVGVNVDNMYKLVDILKDLKNIKYWEVKEEYYENMNGGNEHSHRASYNDGNSYRRKRDAMGRYSRAHDREVEHYDEYSMAKESYRNHRTSDCKNRLMETLDDYMDSFTEKMQEMLKDADCSEERETIKRYIDKLKSFS